MEREKFLNVTFMEIDLREGQVFDESGFFVAGKDGFDSVPLLPLR